MFNLSDDFENKTLGMMFISSYWGQTTSADQVSYMLVLSIFQSKCSQQSVSF